MLDAQLVLDRGFIRWRPGSAAWHPGSVLSQAGIGSFAADGFVAVRGAVPPGAADACRVEIWPALGGLSVLREDPFAWRDPVMRIACPESEASAAAGAQPTLGEEFGPLIGEGRWLRSRGADGLILVRFAGQADPGDGGWHIEARFGKGGDRRVNHRFRGRGLLDKHGRFAQTGQLQGVRRRTRTRTWVIRSTLRRRS